MALILTAMGTQITLSPRELHVLWPTCAMGFQFTDWADGNTWHFLRLLLVFFGNGAIYGFLACCFGALVEALRHGNL